ncbi:hypothetical protein N7513_004311 [Penicillium frequentans]|nr:hypothetical protein N7513_004311 [Penicillium glabrum]
MLRLILPYEVFVGAFQVLRFLKYDFAAPWRFEGAIFCFWFCYCIIKPLVSWIPRISLVRAFLEELSDSPASTIKHYLVNLWNEISLKPCMSTSTVTNQLFLVSQAMSDPVAAPAAPNAPRTRNRRRGRGPANREGRQNTPGQPTDGQPPMQTPQAQPDVSLNIANSNEQSRPRRGNREGGGSRPRRGRGNGSQKPPIENGEQSGQPAQAQSRGMRARGFGARLTKPGQESEDLPHGTVADSLRADVPDFVPGMPASNIESAPSSGKGKGKAKPKGTPKPPKVTTKSIANDIATRIHEDIAHNLLGGAPAVIFHTSISLLLTLAGVRRRLILGHFLVYLPTPVVRHVPVLARAVLIRVTRLVTLVHVLLVRQWDQHRTAFVVEILPQNGVKTLIMNRVGAAERSVVTFFPVENISALSHVMKGYVVLAKSRSTPVVIAGKFKPKCYAAPKKMKWTVKPCMLMERRKNGQGFSAARILATGPSTVEYIHAKRPATPKNRFLRIAPNHRTLSSDAHVAKQS